MQSLRIGQVMVSSPVHEWFAFSYEIMRLYDRRHERCSDHAYKDRVEMTTGSVDVLDSGKT